MDSENLKRLFKSAGLALVSVIVTFVFLEGCTALYSRIFTDYDLEMWKYAKHLKLEVSDQRGHIHQANKKVQLMGVEVETDRLGNRSCGFAKTDSKPQLVFIGDSVSFGWGVPAADSFACLIGGSFLKKNPEGTVRNFAVGNYNSQAIEKQFQDQVLPLRPQIIVYGFYINDIELVSLHEDSFLSRHSIFVAWIKGLLHRAKWWGKGEHAYEEFYRDLYSKNKLEFMRSLDQLKAKADQIGAKFYVVLLPDLNVSGSSAIDGIYDDINSHLKDHGIDAVNLQPNQEWRNSSSWVSKQDSHPNKETHRLIYQAFCQKFSDVCKE